MVTDIAEGIVPDRQAITGRDPFQKRDMNGSVTIAGTIISNHAASSTL